MRKLSNLFLKRFLAPLAVRLKLDWPRAYYVAGCRIRENYKKIIREYRGQKTLLVKIEKIENDMIQCFEKFAVSKPDIVELADWITANKIIIDKLIRDLPHEHARIQRVAETMRELVQCEQLDKLDIEFIPRGLAFGSIGMYEYLEVYIKAGILGLHPLKSLILLNEGRVTNPHYLKYWSRYVKVISSPALIRILSELEKTLTIPFFLYMPFSQKALPSHLSLGTIRQRWIREKRPPILTLSSEDAERGWRCLKTIGLEKGWFVCLHVRESGWSGDHYGSQFRNAEIDTYLDAIKAIVEAGGWVIRMGDRSMKPLPPMEHVIDYAHSDMKSDWMDIFLCAQCRFFIGTSSGVYTVAMAFGVPVVMTNLLQSTAMFVLTSQDLFIPKMCKLEGRTCRFDELISPPLGIGIAQYEYDAAGVNVVDNTPQEIRDVVVEMLDRLDGNIHYSISEEQIQEEFQSLASCCAGKYGGMDIQLHARIGRIFLRNYSSLISNKKPELVSCEREAG